MKKYIKIILSVLLFVVTGLSNNIFAQYQNSDVFEYPGLNQQNYRANINIPNLNGYETLKCDFHIHSVFSDGKVWPSMRVDEAWNDGLDAIAITDHVEVHKNKEVDYSDLNRSNEIAIQRGRQIGMLVIKGMEITHKKPLGHINALFIEDVNKIDHDDGLKAIDEAAKQGAYLFLNHPGWPNDTSTLYSIHKELIEQNKLHGVEVFNSNEQYPKALDWCNKYRLSPFSNTDLHYISADLYREKLQRPMTLVFVKERSIEGIREALFAGRTLAFFDNHLVGKEEFIKGIIEKSISVKIINPKKNTIEVSNTSDITYQIRFGKYMYSIPLFVNKTLRINIPSGTDVTFTNCLIGQGKYVIMRFW